jgi:hypothetical protein
MKITLLCLFLLCLTNLYSQETIKPYQVISKSPDFAVQNKLDQVDPMYFDLYRSKEVDNTVIVQVDGQEISVLLLSAKKLREMGQRYDEGLVEKGAIMSGVKANQPRTFVWKIEGGSQIQDLTTY